MTELEAAIEELYRAFADVQKPPKIEGCPCCIEESELKRLTRIPLREITEAELASYASSALLTVGDVTDYVYFLPRILEISIKDEYWWPSIEVTARAIQLTDLYSWPEPRRHALVHLLLAVVTDFVGNEELSRIDDWMCAIGRMGVDVRPFLQIIEQSPGAVLQFWKDNAGKLDQGLLANAFWERRMLSMTK